MRSGAALDTMGELAERVRPVTLAREQRLPVLPAFEDLLPGGSLRRGATLVVIAISPLSMKFLNASRVFIPLAFLASRRA